MIIPISPPNWIFHDCYFWSWWVLSSLGNTFVRMSAGICSICMNVGCISFHSTLSHSQNSLRSSCFILPWCSGFWPLVWLTDCQYGDLMVSWFWIPFLIEYFTSSRSLHWLPWQQSIWLQCRIVQWSLVIGWPAYSTSSYLMMYLPVDHPLSLHPPWSASEKVVKIWLDDFSGL